MDKITIEGVRPYDGSYDLDLSHFTNREWGIIKRISGVLPDTFQRHALAADAELIVALAVIALRRASIEPVEDLLWDADAGRIQFVADQAKEPDAPLASTQKTQPADGDASDTTRASSGNGSGNGSASPATDLNVTGTPV